MEKIIVIMIIQLFWYFPVKAEDIDLSSLQAKDVIEMSQDISDMKGVFDINPAKPEKNEVKDWTVMVFMNAKNNLAESQFFGLVGKWAEKDIDEMKKVGSTDKINVVVEYGKKGEGSKRMLILKKGLLSSGEKIYGTYPSADMGDYKRVIDFVRWGKSTFPARKYMLIIWNHGLGWIDPNLQQHTQGTGTGSKGIAFDDETKNYIRTKQLGEILRQTGYVDILAMNACLMQMTEVAYEMKDLAGLIVGSEETMLATGFDYEKLLNFMNSNPNFSNEQISVFFMNWYKQFFADGMHIVGPINLPLDSIPATLSTINPKTLNDIPQYLNYFADSVMKNNETAAVKEAIANVIRFTSIADPVKDKKKMLAPYVDLYDFARIVGEKAISPETKKAAQYLMSFIKNKLVVKSIGLNKDTENGYDYSKVGGIAINMTMKIKPVPPQFDSILETKYEDLTLSRDSLWDEFVKWSNEVWAK